MTANKRDYYEVLSVSRDSDLEEIKRAYRKAAVQHHPDKNPGDPTAADKFKEATEAYKVLSDPEQRRIYDSYGHQGLEGAGFRGFENLDEVFQSFDIFGSVLGDLFGFGGGRGRRRTAATKGATLRARVALSFEEAFKGGEKELEISGRAPCPRCGGSGAEAGGAVTCRECGGSGQLVTRVGFMTMQTPCARCSGTGRFISRPCEECRGAGDVRTKRTVKFRIPPGVDTGDQMGLSGQGEPGRYGGPPGDLLVVFEVAPHRFLKRDGADLHMELPISFIQAALGDKLEIETLEGKTTAKVEPGTQPADIIRLRRMGMPDPNSGRRGDLLVHVRVVIPTDLTREQKKALEALAPVFHQKR